MFEASRSKGCDLGMKGWSSCWGELEWDCCYTDLPEFSKLQSPSCLALEVSSQCSCPVETLTAPRLIRSLVFVSRDFRDLCPSPLPPLPPSAHAGTAGSSPERRSFGQLGLLLLTMSYLARAGGARRNLQTVSYDSVYFEQCRT